MPPRCPLPPQLFELVEVLSTNLGHGRGCHAGPLAALRSAARAPRQDSAKGERAGNRTRAPAGPWPRFPSERGSLPQTIKVLSSGEEQEKPKKEVFNANPEAKDWSADLSNLDFLHEAGA